MPVRSVILLCVSFGVLLLGWLAWRNSPSRLQAKVVALPAVNKLPPTIVNHTFDPTAPPSGMPPLTGAETALCESNFVSDANVMAMTRQTDDTHATVTITQVKLTLQLNIDIWVPVDVTQHVRDHEDGHRQISEFYYHSADKVAARVAAPYIGKQVEISGADLGAESNKTLRQIASEITNEFNKQLNPDPTQRHYDDLTDHSRYDITSKDAVALALKDVTMN